MAIDAKLIKESFALVEKQGEIVIEYFYAHLFAHHPEVRPLFPVGMTEQRDRLFHALAVVAQRVDDLAALAPILEQLGRDHRKFDVLNDHYDAVGASLLATLELFAEDAWTPEVAAAWTAAYALAAQVMAGAADAAGGAPRYWLADVTAHERRAWDMAVVTVKPRQPFAYLPGQYVTVETPQWPKLWRSYSIGNAPRADGTLDLHIKQVDAGQVSWALVDGVRVGDLLKLGPPMGTMILAGTPCDLLLVAGGTGLAPLKALVEHLTTQPSERAVHLFVGARDADRLYDLPALTVLARLHPWLAVTPVVSNDPTYAGTTGNVGEVAAAYQTWIGHEAYVCGPLSMVTSTIRLLTEAGMSRRRIHQDALQGAESPTLVAPEAAPASVSPAAAPLPKRVPSLASSVPSPHAGSTDGLDLPDGPPATDPESPHATLVRIRRLIERRRSMRLRPVERSGHSYA